VAGTSGKVRLEGDDDAEGASTEQQGAAIREALGTETRNKVRCSQVIGFSISVITYAATFTCRYRLLHKAVQQIAIKAQCVLP